MELTKERLVIIIVNAKEKLPGIIITGIAILFLGLYFFVYKPLISKIQIASAQCKKIEADVLWAHKIISSFKAESTKKNFIIGDNISSAIDELTNKSKAKGLNFISITPKQIEKQKGDYKIMPIEMEIDSTYDALGVFLGEVDDLKRSFTKIEKFTVIPDETKPLRVKTKLTLNMYLENAE